MPFAAYGFTLAVDDGWVAFSTTGGIDARLFFARKVAPGEWVETQDFSVGSLSTPRELAMSGGVLVVADMFNGDPFDPVGRAVIFERGQDDGWSQVAVLQPVDLVPGSSFGQFVAASGDRVAVVAPFTFVGGDREAIYVFRREASGAWVQEDRVELFDGFQGFEQLGLAMDGDSMVLFEGTGFKGECFFRFSAFERDAQSRWILRARIEDEAPCRQISVALRGDIAVVGDSALSGPAGMFTGGVRVYRRQASGAWIRGEDLIPADAGANSFVGGSIDFDGRTVVAGSVFALPNSFFAFESQPDGTFADIGRQSSVMIPGNANVGFGQSIGVDGDDAVVGVPSAANLDGLESGVLAFFEREGPEDTDGDGLLDDWEENGIPYAKADGSTARYMLPGADPLRKDIYIEVDVGASGIPQASRDAVVAAFAASPVSNPDGSSGITLHIVMDESQVVPPNPTVAFGGFPLDFEQIRAERFGTQSERADPEAAALLDAKHTAFRYCYAYAGLTFTGNARPIAGRGLINGPAFLINLGSGVFNDGRHDDQDIAATFMHELGHLLGLRHGGSDNTLGKPNYPSIMNYTMTHPLPWNQRFWRLDYSREELGTLDEAAIDESAGIDSSLYRRTFLPYGVGPDTARSFRLVKLAGRPTDFNGDGVRGGVVAADLNFVGTNAGVPVLNLASPNESLPGFNDWQNLIYTIGVGTDRGEPQGTDGCPDDLTLALLESLVVPACEVDLDGNGVLNFFDVAAYLAAFSAGDLEADVAEPFGVLNFFDLAQFIQDFSAGCP
jgi:hypothetical protein